MITSLDGYSAIVEARKAEKERKPGLILTPQQQEARRKRQSRIDRTVVMIVNIAKSLEQVSQRVVYRRLIEKEELGETHDERLDVFLKAWAIAANTAKRQYISNLYEECSPMTRTRGRKPRPARRPTRQRARYRAA